MAVFQQAETKNIQLQKENELKDALLKIETQNKLQEQRLRISRDLHDTIGAQLTFIISSIDNLKYGFQIEDERLQNRLAGISEFTKETIYELRDTIWAMNMNQINFEDLKSRISNFIDNAKISSIGIDFQFVYSDAGLCKRTFTSVEGMNIYRIIQETINNSIKHSGAGKIAVTIDGDEDNLVIEVTDNGKGFSPGLNKEGNGLNNIRKRAKEIGGEIELNSKPGEGTAMKLFLPNNA
ncbi:sensor histidine kinase [Flavobacterium lindanitolerans]|nr:sensor histidine kinase [Flavobacterium lindanitolerans]